MSDQPVPAPAPPVRGRRRRWLVLAAAGLVAVITGVAVAVVVFGGEDPGVTACKTAADNARRGHRVTRVESAKMVAQLRDSSEGDLRRMGERLDEFGDGMSDPAQVGRAVTLGAEMIAVCAKHGVVIDVS